MRDIENNARISSEVCLVNFFQNSGMVVTLCSVVACLNLPTLA